MNDEADTVSGTHSPEDTSAETSHDAPHVRVRGKRVLIADDNRDAADSLAAVIETFGHVTAVAYDGTGVLGLVDVFRPNVILLDLSMPRMSGLEVARQLRLRPDGATFMLLAVTGWGDPRERARARTAGFDAHLVKPIDLSRLEALLRLSLPALRRTTTGEDGAE